MQFDVHRYFVFVPTSSQLTAALEEYRALRAEIIEAIQAQRTIMQLGITGLSALIGLGLQRIPPFLAAVVLALLVPTLTLSVTGAAFGEFSRAVRASAFLAGREQLINESVGDPRVAMDWERWLRRRPVSVARERAQFLALFVLSTGSLALGWHTVIASTMWTDADAALRSARASPGVERDAPMKTLPDNPNLDHLRRQAKDLLAGLRDSDPAASLADAQAFSPSSTGSEPEPT